MIEGLDKSVNEIVALVESKTGKGIEFLKQPNLESYAAVKMARSDMPKHIIAYNPAHVENLNHLIPHECGHILRFFSALPFKRVVPYTTDDMYNATMDNILDDISPIIQRFATERGVSIVKHYYANIMKGLINYPPDIMVEKWLYTNYPSLRPYQVETINEQFADVIYNLRSETNIFAWTNIFHSSFLLCYAFFRVMGELLNVNYVRSFGTNVDIARGKELVRMLKESTEDSYESDIAMVNKWASYLKLTDWFRWVPFETME